MWFKSAWDACLFKNIFTIALALARLPNRIENALFLGYTSMRTLCYASGI